MKIILILIASLSMLNMQAQTATDSIVSGTTVVFKDPRIDILGKKMAEYNSNLGSIIYANGLTSAKGYRLMLISTSDRELAMKVRSQLYQIFPEEVQYKQYMSFQTPNIKIKFGNFLDKNDAEKIKKQILALKLVTGNIYIIPETIEVKPIKDDKDKTLDK